MVSIWDKFFLISRPNIENLGFLPQVCSTSSSIRQYQSFLKNVFWIIERLRCKAELGCSDKIHSDKKITFFAYLTKKSWRLEKVHVNFIFLVGYYWLFKLVRSSTLKKTVYLSRSSFSSGNLISSSNHDYVRSRRMHRKYAKKPTIFRKIFDINLGSWVKSVVFLPYMFTFIR